MNGQLLVGWSGGDLQPKDGRYVYKLNFPIPVEESSWVAVRCTEDRDDKRLRFAHTAPIWIDVPGKPLRPRAVEVEFLIRRVEDELARNKDVLTPEGLAEYQEALAFYKGKLKDAR